MHNIKNFTTVFYNKFIALFLPLRTRQNNKNCSLVVTIIGVDHREGGSIEDISMSIKSNNCASTD